MQNFVLSSMTRQMERMAQDHPMEWKDDGGHARRECEWS